MPQTLTEFLELLVPGETHSRKAIQVAILAYFARHPGSAGRFPPEWVQQLTDIGCWVTDDVQRAVDIGARIRDYRFIDLPTRAQV